MGKKGLQQQKLTKQKAKLLLRQGGEMEDILYTSMVEKMRKGGDAERLTRDAETGIETSQAYKLGGGTHNTYSGKSSKKK